MYKMQLTNVTLLYTYEIAYKYIEFESKTICINGIDSDKVNGENLIKMQKRLSIRDFIIVT